MTGPESVETRTEPDTPPSVEGEAVLVVDDDPDIRAFLEVTLSLGGFEVLQATDGAEAVDTAIAEQPAIILMDVMMPDTDGVAATQRLRRDGRTSHIPIIMLTAKSQMDDRIEGFTAGADDYITKPFDPEELVARVQAILRRSRQMRTMSPLTGLPGNVRIDQEVARRLEADDEFALLYADLNSFKAVNDHYGPMRGDEVLKAFAIITKKAAAEHGDPETFVGHVGGDDFVVIAGTDQYRPIAEAICQRFDDAVREFYDDEDLERGYIEVTDRRGVPARYGVVSVSIGVATTDQRDFEHQTEVMEVATEMKTYAKQHASEEVSNWAVDRRADEDAAG